MAALEKTIEEKLYSTINDINQVLKRFDSYTYLADQGLFIGVNSERAYEFIYVPQIDETVCPALFKRNFKITDGNLLFAILKDVKPKTLEYEHGFLINAKGESFQVQFIDTEEIEQNYSILSVIDSVEDNNLVIDSTQANLYFNGELISNPFSVNDLVDVLKNNVSTTSDHTLPFFQIREDELHIFSEFTDINLGETFVILDCDVFKKLKILKKDTPFLDFYILENGRIVINYGVHDKEQFTISVNGIFRL